MSFIPSRDVFSMTDSHREYADSLYDEVEAAYLDDWARDEYGHDWTWKRVQEETNNHCYPTIGGYDMLMYLINRKEWNSVQPTQEVQEG